MPGAVSPKTDSLLERESRLWVQASKGGAVGLCFIAWSGSKGEHFAREGHFVFGGAHDGLGAFDAQTVGAEQFGSARVTVVADQDVDELLVRMGDADN